MIGAGSCFRNLDCSWSGHAAQRDPIKSASPINDCTYGVAASDLPALGNGFDDVAASVLIVDVSDD
jgi:hypothetical protein